MTDTDSLIERVHAVYERLARDDNNNVSQYHREANADESLFALVLSNVLRSRVTVSYDQYGRVIDTPDGATFAEILSYANDKYGYRVCERCDSDICEHVNN